MSRLRYGSLVCLSILMALLMALLMACQGSDPAVEQEVARPNILLIVADDMGYTDVGFFGAEIATPNLDELAFAGLRFTNFHVGSSCSPTRAMLMSGVTNREVGVSGPAAVLADNVATLPALLRDAGYHTYMAGKWHLGHQPRHSPTARGFESSFALVRAGDNHLGASNYPDEDVAYRENGEPIENLPDGWFSSELYTDKLIEHIRANESDGVPWFGYLAFTAPHWPLQLPEDWIDRYAGRYDDGYDVVRASRVARARELGVLPDGLDLEDFQGAAPAWVDLDGESQQTYARAMELYAAMVENLDHHVGRLLDYLREIGEYDDTLIVFLSDNGAEPGDRGPTGMDRRDQEWFSERFPARSFARWGKEGSFIEYGPAWAQVSMVPFRLFKGTQAEGGIRSPLILSGVGVETRKSVTDALLHVTDLAPTFLELAKVPHPRQFQERSVAPLQGSSLLPLLSGRWRERNGPNEWLGMAFAGDRAVRRGDWKLVWMPPPFGAGKWRLYRLDRDPAELFDRAEEEEDKMAEGLELWEEYARANGVVLPTAAEPEVADDTDATEEPQP